MNGALWSFQDGKYVEQSNVFFLPKGMELVILANSPLRNPDTGFMGQVLDTIEANIESTLLSAFVVAISAVALMGAIRQGTRRGG